MDYYELLKRYMSVVLAEEGTTFVNSSLLSKEDAETLKLIEAEIDDE